MRAMFVVFALSVPLVGCPSEPSSPAAPADPASASPSVDWTRAISHSLRFDPAQSAVVVQVKVAPGFHAYTAGETIGRPLALELAPDGAYALSGDVVLPQGVTKDLPIGRSVIVEGTVEVVGPIAKKPDQQGPVAGTFRYQVCNDTACDRPRSAPFSLTP